MNCKRRWFFYDSLQGFCSIFFIFKSQISLIDSFDQICPTLMNFIIGYLVILAYIFYFNFHMNFLKPLYIHFKRIYPLDNFIGLEKNLKYSMDFRLIKINALINQILLFEVFEMSWFNLLEESFHLFFFLNLFLFLMVSLIIIFF